MARPENVQVSKCRVNTWGGKAICKKKQPQEKFSTKSINITMVSADASSPCLHLQKMIGIENLRDAKPCKEFDF